MNAKDIAALVTMVSVPCPHFPPDQKMTVQAAMEHLVVCPDPCDIDAKGLPIRHEKGPMKGEIKYGPEYAWTPEKLAQWLKVIGIK